MLVLNILLPRCNKFIWFLIKVWYEGISCAIFLSVLCSLSYLLLVPDITHDLVFCDRTSSLLSRYFPTSGIKSRGYCDLEVRVLDRGFKLVRGFEVPSIITVASSDERKNTSTLLISR